MSPALVGSVEVISPWLSEGRILKTLCSKLRISGDVDFRWLAKATPGYVGADLTALTTEAGVIAVKRIFEEFGQAGNEPDGLEQMTIDDLPFASLPSPLRDTAIARFLITHPSPLNVDQLSALSLSASDFSAALKIVQPSAKREGFATVPDVTWADVGALGQVRDELHMAIVQPIRHPELFNVVGIDAPSGVLLWGPPGCGKTLLAKAVANESRTNFISVKGPELLNKVSQTFVRRGFALNLPVCRRIGESRQAGVRPCQSFGTLCHLLRRARRTCPSSRRVDGECLSVTEAPGGRLISSVRVFRACRQHPPHRAGRSRHAQSCLHGRCDQSSRHD